MSSATYVTSTFVDPSSAPVAGALVVATLLGEVSPSSTVSAYRVETTRTDADGIWTLALIPNSAFGTSTCYLVRVGTKEDYYITVPVTLDDTPVDLFSILRSENPVESRAAFTGTMTLDGDLTVNGDITVTGDITTDEIYEYATLNPAYIPTFPGSLEIIGDLVVSGSISAKGTVTAGV